MTREEMAYDSRVLRFQFDNENGIYALDNVFGSVRHFTTKRIVYIYDIDDLALLNAKLEKTRKLKSGKLGIKLNPSLEKQFNKEYEVQY